MANLTLCTRYWHLESLQLEWPETHWDLAIQTLNFTPSFEVMMQSKHPRVVTLLYIKQYYTFHCGFKFQKLYSKEFIFEGI